MKIKDVVIVCFLIVIATMLPSCGLFNGGNNCDCPKFGFNAQENVIMVAWQAASIANLD